ncbi:MAG: DUF3179 domain-containing protein [Planctomycetaceae bacterium]|nr:MAG: DUF3179 domain-containing protein [Planctomycetaceae bacterium]
MKILNYHEIVNDRGGRPESLWSQMKAAGVSGPGVSQSLRAVPFELTTWQDWQTRYPRTMRSIRKARSWISNWATDIFDWPTTNCNGCIPSGSPGT